MGLVADVVVTDRGARLIDLPAHIRILINQTPCQVEATATETYVVIPSADPEEALGIEGGVAFDDGVLRERTIAQMVVPCQAVERVVGFRQADAADAGT